MIVRVRRWVPVPHVLEHAVHAVHAVVKQVTGVSEHLVWPASPAVLFPVGHFLHLGLPDLLMKVSASHSTHLSVPSLSW